VKVWIDLTSLPHIHFFRALIKRLEKSGNDVLVTSREFGIMDDILKKNNIEHVNIGLHGGKGLESKLVRSSERVSSLAKFISREKPDIGLSKHSVECTRVCFGLKIPSITVIDHETAEPAMRLMVPLTDFIVSPKAASAETIRGFGARKVSQFYGVCETAHFLDFSPSRDVLEGLGLSEDKKILIARSEPMLSSHNYHESKLFAVLKEIKQRFPDVQMVFIPRGISDIRRSGDLDLIVPERSIDTLSLYSYASLMIGAGSCMNREACVGGCPTISICPDNLPGVDRFLISKKMMFHTLEKEDIVRTASDILDGNSPLGKKSKPSKDFEDPYKKIMTFMKNI